jgi:anaerobic C4-dicarboxylate transporter DcuA/anaerobic C4-dicarboxylate transporter DcuB
LFPDLRPVIGEGEEAAPLGMSPTIEMLMLSAGVLIILFCRPKVAEVPNQTVFKAGMVSAIALFGLAWMTDTFISANYDLIVDTIGQMVNNYVFLFALAVFLVAALTTSQSTATRTMVPIGLASGLSPGVVTGMWAGGMSGVYTLPTNGTQIAAANFDLSGTTKLGTKLYDHSFFMPMLVMTLTITLAGLIIGSLVG